MDIVFFGWLVKTLLALALWPFDLAACLRPPLFDRLSCPGLRGVYVTGIYDKLLLLTESLRGLQCVGTEAS